MPRRSRGRNAIVVRIPATGHARERSTIRFGDRGRRDGSPWRSERMVKPYTAVGLIPTVRGIRRRQDIQINLDHLSHLVKAASWLSSLDLPVRLIAFPEGALQAFNDEVL